MPGCKKRNRLRMSPILHPTDFADFALLYKIVCCLAIARQQWYMYPSHGLHVPVISVLREGNKSLQHCKFKLQTILVKKMYMYNVAVSYNTIFLKQPNDNLPCCLMRTRDGVASSICCLLYSLWHLKIIIASSMQTQAASWSWLLNWFYSELFAAHAVTKSYH